MSRKTLSSGKTCPRTISACSGSKLGRVAEFPNEDWDKLGEFSKENPGTIFVGIFMGTMLGISVEIFTGISNELLWLSMEKIKEFPLLLLTLPSLLLLLLLLKSKLKDMSD